MFCHKRMSALLVLMLVLLQSSFDARAADKVTFVTDFGYLGRHAYYFVALDKGFYKDQGIDVNIVRGQGSVDAVKQVAAGAAQMGFADAASVILAQANDGVPVKLVAMIYAKPPHAIFVLKGSGISKPKDLEGRNIGDSAFSSVPRLFNAYAKAANIDASKVRWSVISSDALAPSLALGRVDGVGQYVVGEALLQKAVAPKEVARLAFSDVGMDFYSNGIIADEKYIASNPDIVRRFVAATLRGLSYSIANPEEAGRILNKIHRQVDVDIGIAEIKAVGSLVQTPPEPLGAIDPARLQRTIDIVSEAFTLKKPVTVESLYAPGFVSK
jgi:NitT/TauT family transport system substrate-binding protein